MYKIYDEDINDFLKKLILKLKKKYKLDIFGFYQVNVYKNDMVGMIVDIIKDDDASFLSDWVDLKINVYDNSEVWLKFDDYFLDLKEKFYKLEDTYYTNITDIDKKSFLSMIEFCCLLYGEELELVKRKILNLTSLK